MSDILLGSVMVIPVGVGLLIAVMIGAGLLWGIHR
jgi:nitrogen fixation-related uncharacterized protein